MAYEEIVVANFKGSFYSIISYSICASIFFEAVFKIFDAFLKSKLEQIMTYKTQIPLLFYLLLPTVSQFFSNILKNICR